MAVAADEDERVAPFDVVIRWITTAGLLFTSFLVLTPTEDSFRLPKELAARTEAILLVAVIAIVWIWRARIQWTKVRWRDAAVVITAAIVLWTAFTALVSTQRVISLRTLIWVVAAAAVFMAIYATARKRSLEAIYALVGAGVANSLLAILQEKKIWNPIPARVHDLAPHLYTSGLIGNPDDLGGFLVVAVIAAAALAVSRREGRVVSLIGLLIIAAGLGAAQSVAAFLATAAGFLIMTWMHSRRAFAIAFVAVIAGAIVAVTLLGSVRMKIRQLPEIADEMRHGDAVLAIENLSSNRLAPALAAWQMFASRPLVGVGPGCFGPHYFFEALCAQYKHPSMRKSGTSYFHFGEAHNDHLEALAVAGFPAYALFIAAPIALALRSRRAIPGEDERKQFARLCGPALAAAFLVLTLFQFPLELAGVTMALLYVAALVMQWSNDAAD